MWSEVNNSRDRGEEIEDAIKGAIGGFRARTRLPRRPARPTAESIRQAAEGMESMQGGQTPSRNRMPRAERKSADRILKEGKQPRKKR